MMVKIQDVDVKNALRKGTKGLEAIHNRILALYKELTDVDGMIRSLSLPSARYESSGGGKTGDGRDLSDFMAKHEQLSRQREIEIREEMRNLTDEEEMINRIRVCFQTLQDREYDILNELYVKGHPYKFVETHSQLSHKTFETTRKSGIRKIIQLYESNYSNQEIITRRQRIYRNNGKKDEVAYQQLKLNLDI